MLHLEIHLLGPFEVMLDGEPVTGFATDKVRALLAYLTVTSDRPHRRETLAGLLWPEYPERSARASLRNVLANLRKVIGDRDAAPPFLRITRQTIQFSGDSDHWLDVAAFTTLLEDGEPSSEALEEALALYRGPFLDGFSMPDSTAFEEWLLLTREQLGRQEVDTLRTLISAYEGRGEYERALPHAWRQVEREPWQEEGHQQLMRLLALSGRRSEALAQYEACRQVLAEELGVEPLPATTELYERIRKGDLSGRDEQRPKAGAVPPQFQSLPRHNLPAPPTPFVGREKELAEVEDLLAEQGVRLVTIVGAGGSGKTRLALEVGTRAARRSGLLQEGAERDQPSWIGLDRNRRFRDGVFFVPLASVGSAEEMVPTITQALRVHLEGGIDPLLDYLRAKQILLILDNLEHLSEGAGLLAEILGAALNVKILTTSRERLQIHGEHLFPIGGLAYPEHDPVPAEFAAQNPETCLDSYLEAFPAAQLFVDSARRIRPQLTLDPDALVTLSQICRLVEGLPLALELAAPWVDVLSLADIRSEMQQNLDFLQSESRDLPRRQRSMRAVFDRSWDQLGRTEQTVFTQLSVFRGGFTRLAAEQVAMQELNSADQLRTLSQLAGRMFIQYEQGHDRYQCHELLRQYGAQKLAQDPARERETQDRHCAYYVAAVERWGEEFKGPRQQNAMAAMGMESENARTAWSWAVAQGRVQRLTRALEGLCLFYARRGRYQEGETACRQLVDRVSPPGSDVELRLLVRALGWQSVFSHALGNIDLANEVLGQSLTLLDAAGAAGPESVSLPQEDIRLEGAFVLRQMARMAHLSSVEQARQLLEQSLALYRELDDRWVIANVLDELGAAAEQLASYDRAQALNEESLAIRRALGDLGGIAHSHFQLAIVSRVKGELEAAERLFRESLVAYRDLGARANAGALESHLADMLVRRGRFADGVELVEHSLALHRDMGHRHELAWIYSILAEAEAHLGRYESARVHAKRAVTLSEETADRWAVGYSRFTSGLAALGVQDWAEAHRSLSESISALQQMRHQEHLNCAIGMSAYAIRGLGLPVQAARCLAEALKSATKVRTFFALLYALPAAALLFADRGEAERAVEVYALAARHPFVAYSHWFDAIAGRQVADAANGLPPEAVEAAQARGQALDLWQTAASLPEELAGLGAFTRD